MLKQDAVPAESSVPPVSVAQARVTPDELSQALAAIEARRQAEANTIPIDQAVSDLHLDSTSDEIWAEVLVLRAKTAATEHQTSPQAHAPQVSEIRQKLLRRLDLRKGIVAALVFYGLYSLQVIPNFWNHHAAPAAAPILRPLAQEPDGKPVYADDAALIQLSEGKPASRITISENATGNRWPLVKMGDHVYLHGYIASTDSLISLQGKALKVYNDDNSGGLAGEATSRITLRVDNTPLQQSGGGDSYTEVTVPNFQPDPLTTLSDWH